MQYNTVLLKKQEDFLYLIKISIGMRGIAPLCGAGNEPPFSFRLAPISVCGRSRFATRYPGGSGSDSGKRSRASRFCSPMHGSSASRAARLQVSAKQGDPAKTQRSGFRGERTSIGMSELSAQAGSEEYGDCEDEDRAQRFDWSFPQHFLAGTPRFKQIRRHRRRFCARRFLFGP